MRIRAAADAYALELRAKGASATLLDQTRRSLDRFASHLRERGVRDVRDVEEAHLASFASELRQTITARGKPLAAASRAAYLQRVRSFLSSLTRKGLLLRDPAADLKLPSASPIPRLALNVGQAARLMAAPAADTKTGRRDRAILELLYGTGIRRGECARLDVSDLDLGERTLLVRSGKGSKDRMVPVLGRAAAALALYLRDVRPELVEDPGERALFLTAWRGRRLSPVSITFLLRGHATGAGIARVHPHALRHTCATHLLKGGADVRHVQVLLGHKRLKTTAIYTRVVVEDLREVLARAHPRERKEGLRARHRTNARSR